MKIQQSRCFFTLATDYLASDSVKTAWCSENQAEQGRERKPPKEREEKKP